jgi:hypothetical protein
MWNIYLNYGFPVDSYDKHLSYKSFVFGIFQESNSSATPTNLNIQILNTKAAYEPAENLVDSCGNK